MRSDINRLSAALLRRASSDPEKHSDSALKAIRDFPVLSVWNLFLAVGGLILLLFFSSIQFLPELDIKSLVAILAALALVAFSMMLIIGVSMMLPSIYLEAKQLEDISARLLHLSEACFGIIGCFLFIAVAFGSNTGIDYWLHVGFFTLSFFALLTIIGVQSRKIYSLDGRALFIHLLKKALPRGVLWGVWCFLLPTFFLVLLRRDDLPAWEEMLLLLAFPLTLATFSIIVARQDGRRRLVATLIAAIGAVFYLGLLTNKVDLIPRMSMVTLGLSIPNKQASLVLTGPSCYAANATVGKEVCKILAGGTQGTIHDARIISRIGSQFLLHLPATQAGGVASNQGKTSEAKWHRLVIRSNDVIAWSYMYEKND